MWECLKPNKKCSCSTNQNTFTMTLEARAIHWFNIPVISQDKTYKETTCFILCGWPNSLFFLRAEQFRPRIALNVQYLFSAISCFTYFAGYFDKWQNVCYCKIKDKKQSPLEIQTILYLCVGRYLLSILLLSNRNLPRTSNN